MAAKEIKFSTDARDRMLRGKKRDFVEKGGWATMPGQTMPDRRAAEGCAVALAA